MVGGFYTHTNNTVISIRYYYNNYQIVPTNKPPVPPSVNDRVLNI
jgi:hypothetical protein